LTLNKLAHHPTLLVKNECVYFLVELIYNFLVDNSTERKASPSRLSSVRVGCPAEVN